jgi:opacity protein-like surface antigen
VRRLILALIPFLAADAGAQIIRRPPGMQLQEPTWWVSGGVGLTQGWSVHDGTTDTQWDFSDATQAVVSIERTMSSGVTLGLRGTTSRVPLLYSGTLRTAATGSFDADANVSQLMAGVRLATGREFHTVLEVGVGATLYSNFRERSSDAKLAPDSDTDFTFAFGYGLGYAFSPTFSVDVVQDLTTAVHQKTGLSAGTSSTSRLNGTRLVARLGLGR